MRRPEPLTVTAAVWTRHRCQSGVELHRTCPTAQAPFPVHTETPQYRTEPAQTSCQLLFCSPLTDTALHALEFARQMFLGAIQEEPTGKQTEIKSQPIPELRPEEVQGKVRRDGEAFLCVGGSTDRIDTSASFVRSVPPPVLPLRVTRCWTQGPSPEEKGGLVWGGRAGERGVRDSGSLSAAQQ
ncbi:hypothetical protein ROHU_031184 [Labeo rohita]|uniref:Uncharacterized protein n=1 Tax=Labeo rohita TaxID=84645 RepID=A0A498LSS8_LABRO|nr:hypothetical protein ROHU_031184 [Labeo rohita]